MSSTYLITGCSRGLGLALATELCKAGHRVIATSRGDPTLSLKKLIDGSSGLVKHVKLDVTNRASVEEAENQVEVIVGGQGIDVLINNAAVIHGTPEGLHTMDDLDSTFSTNVTGVHNVTTTFLSLLRKGRKKKVINISSAGGSLAMAQTYSLMPVPSYKISKAALNMLTVQYAQSYAKEGFTFLLVSPGWLRTDLGGDDADLDVETGAKAVLEVVEKHGKESNGKFLNIHVAGWEEAPGLNQYDGKTIPW